jgi:hypothetical protein
MPQAHGHERECQRQPGKHVPRREPEAEHGRGQECRHQQLGTDRGGAEGGRQQGPADLGHRLRQALPMGMPEPPQAREGDQEHRGPAQQPVLAVDEQRYQPVAPPEVAAWRVGVGGVLAGRVGGVGRGAAVERLVEGHVERHREQRKLHRSHGQRPPLRPPQLARGHHADHQAGRHELGPQPGKRPEQRKAEERLHTNDALAQAQRQQRRPAERGARGELGIDGAAVRHERWAEPDGERGAKGPRVRRRSQREPVSERHSNSSDRGEEQLHPVNAADRVGRCDQQGEAEPVRLVQTALRRAAMPPELVWIELRVRALAVLVEHVHVAVLDDRLGGQQVVRLVAAVVRRAERVQAERGRVDGEQQQPEGEGATHRRRTLASRAYATTAISS